MVFGPAWQLSAAGMSCRAAVPAVARNCRPDRAMRPVLGRLKRRAEFLRVAATGRKAVAPGIVLQAIERAMPSSGGKPSIHVGFTASKKVGNAVARNRTKRRLRALAASVLPKHAEGGRDYVLIARQATLSRNFRDLESDLLQALARVGALRSDDKMGGLIS